MRGNELLVNDNPKSAFTESVKSIRTNLSFSSVDHEFKVILMTSPEAGDGKSFIAANLAVTYAEEGKKVLIIDCDLRLGRQHTIFRVNNSFDIGYSNLILKYKKDMKMNKYIVPTENRKIDILPTGPIPPNPIELLGSDQNKNLIEQLKKLYDIIILDCPPIIGLSDTLVMMQLSDVNLLTVSARKTKLKTIEQAKKLVEQVNKKINGVILNKVSMKNSRYDNYYYYAQTPTKTSNRRKIKE